MVRVDKYLASTHPEYSRAAIAKLFKLNLIWLDGQPIRPGHKLRPGATIEYDLEPLQAKPEVIDLPILYEDNDIAVINKPAGVISHARGKFWQEASVASFLRDRVLQQNKDNKSADVLFDTPAVNNSTDLRDTNQSLRAGIVHRLDRATSGVMICAKNKRTLTFLQEQFANRSTKKTYIAVTEKSPRESHANIVAPIGRSLEDPKRFIVDQNAKPAETEYLVLGKSSIGSVIELHPKTGRTHQLRVHLEYINCPIIGDILYKGKPNERLLLHAYKLEIEAAPGRKMTFVAPIPGEFAISDSILDQIL